MTTNLRKLSVTEMQRLTIEEFRKSEKLPLIVVLDDIRSMYNVGSVFRTCDAFRISDIYLCGISPSPPHAEIHKTALGAEESVAWHKVDSAKEIVKELVNKGYIVLAVEQTEGSSRLEDIDISPQKKYALVFGHEVFGINQEVIDLCQACIEIPQWGTKHSLNVAVAAGIVIYGMAIKLCRKEKT